MQTIYIGLDLHATNSLLDILDEEGQEVEYHRFRTSEQKARQLVRSVEADRKLLILEDSTLSMRYGRVLREEVDRLVICNPRENRPISGAIAKNDRADAWRLARQLYKDEQLKQVHLPDKTERIAFRKMFLYYRKAVAEETKMKTKLISWLRHWGADIDSPAGFSHAKCEQWLEQVDERMRPSLQAYWTQLGSWQSYVADCWQRVTEAGADYPEIRQFQRMAGCGPVRSHGISALLVDPDRFPSASKLYTYCRLGVRKHTSDGRQVRHERISRQGQPPLKDLTAGIFHSAVRQQSEPNEIKRFYQASLDRSSSASNARLNTMRKILKTLWIVWKNRSTYDPERFCSGRGKQTAGAGRSGG